MSATTETHTTKDGRTMLLSEMLDRHLLNTIRYIENRAKEGVVIERGGGSIEAGDMWYDTAVVYHEKALEAMEYGKYINELERRAQIIKANDRRL